MLRRRCACLPSCRGPRPSCGRLLSPQEAPAFADLIVRAGPPEQLREIAAHKCIVVSRDSYGALA